MDLKEIQQRYIQAKEVIDALSDGDMALHKNTLAYHARTLSLWEIDNIKRFIAMCEDQGIHQTIRRAD